MGGEPAFRAAILGTRLPLVTALTGALWTTSSIGNTNCTAPALLFLLARLGPPWRSRPTLETLGK